ncbi:heme-binding domain-containing protein [Rubrolithibacter danxiaensis]|uniref:heme-binding domain-containing protein n=1 Tax=Rubrolithibacter danxiaensis TaxID=3390805 RepID=UPI003BF849CE
MIRKILYVLLTVIVLIQFFQPEQNSTSEEQPAAIEKVYIVPQNVQAILSKACTDCHSNNTRYPWYNHIQPVAWFLKHHVDEGKGELNFDEFAAYPLKKQDHKLDELIETQQQGSMPLTSYTIIHRNAVLNDQEKQQLIDWAQNIRKQIQSKIKAKL